MGGRGAGWLVLLSGSSVFTFSTGGFSSNKVKRANLKLCHMFLKLCAYPNDDCKHIILLISVQYALQASILASCSHGHRVKSYENYKKWIMH